MPDGSFFFFLGGGGGGGFRGLGDEFPTVLLFCVFFGGGISDSRGFRA